MHAYHPTFCCRLLVIVYLFIPGTSREGEHGLCGATRGGIVIRYHAIHTDPAPIRKSEAQHYYVMMVSRATSSSGSVVMREYGKRPKVDKKIVRASRKNTAQSLNGYAWRCGIQEGLFQVSLEQTTRRPWAMLLVGAPCSLYVKTGTLSALAEFESCTTLGGRVGPCFQRVLRR